MADMTGSSAPQAPIAPERRLFARLRDRIVASDPAFTRLRMASRAMLSVFINSGILVGITMLVKPLPIAAYGIAVILSFMGAIAVRDRTPHEQVVTRLLAAAASTLVMLLASLLAVKPAIAFAAFIVVIFAAVYIRQYGPRGFFVGMIAFMAYFMGDYLHPKPEQIGWVAVASIIALGVTHFVTHALLPADPEKDFRRAVTTIDRRINLILGNLRQAAHEGALDKPGRKALNDHLTRLRETALMAEGYIPQGKNGALTGSGPASDLAILLFDLQLGVERLVAASFRALPPEWLSQAVLYVDQPEITRARKALEDAPESDEAATERILIRAHRARQRLAAALAVRPLAAFAGDKDEAIVNGPATPEPDEREGGLIPAIYHLPIQVTLACGIAMGSGLLISSQRWYWAVIASFIVFNNTRSRADTMLKALSRSVGTFAGIIAGTIIATVLHGAMAASLIALAVCFFLAYYFLQTSYGVMIFFITIALALLYGLMGVFSPELLVVRLEETLIGAAAGAFCAFFIFPKRASSGVSDALAAYLAAFGAFIAAARERADGGGAEIDILALSRDLDRKLLDVSNAVRPLGGPWSFVTRYGVVREKLLFLTGCAHWARVLARGLTYGRPEGQDVERFDHLAEEIDAELARLQEAKDRFFLTPRGKADSALPREPRRGLAVQEDESPILALEVISALMERATAGTGRATA